MRFTFIAFGFALGCFTTIKLSLPSRAILGFAAIVIGYWFFAEGW